MAALDLFDTQTLVAGAAQIDFVSIPQTHTHLVLRGQVRGDSSGNTAIEFAMRMGQGSFDTGSNYSWIHYHNTGGQVTSTNDSNAHVSRYGVPGPLASAGFAQIEIIVRNYTSTSTSLKMVHSRGVFGSILTGGVALWNNAGACQRVRFYDRLGGNLVTDSYFELYGTDTDPFAVDLVNLGVPSNLSGGLLL